ncbi:threonine synthase [Pseudoflavonifractor sp. AF19-9AC]|uniref:threonine synthase n=1 Tax=Pseudoflavonifractor sp. AF19-9AC TaxID=2292244 RepID=UPI000E4B12DF|nr:threonine synthase [Pseudoflavonifractor sp. AF19-9AC]RHR08878.1 threonine synthase [Pseudoflavonifractor sp. AF19-9AC]
MQYTSTRDTSVRFTASQAISQGLASDGGLLTPCYIPKLPGSALEDLKGMSYQQRAIYIMKQFLEEFSVKELTDFAGAAYGPAKFDTPAVAPVRTLNDNTHCLELWHGPTCAFKDMALQMLPHLLTASLTKTEEFKTVFILVATSGDTGKGALAGFQDVPRTKILVFYPKDGVSQVQQLQMITQEGDNVGVAAVQGNFDDAQTGVKRLFSDEKLRQTLAEKGYFFSSANSINWGRVLPQIVYYVSAYCDLLRDEKITAGQPINVCVPTGNFGNILAAYYAREMGVPIAKLICASNSNNVLTDFICTGTYDRNRTFYNTMSPSMDILISSNLERLLLAMTQDVDEVKGYMEQLNATGRYQVSDVVREKIQKLFCGYCCDDQETQKVIGQVYGKYQYLIDPHTAVAVSALEQYRAETGDNTPCVVVSTASPFKFCDSVLEALGEKEIAPGLDALDQLAEKTGLPAPAPLASLRNKAVRFTQEVDKERMEDAVLSMLE